MYHLPTLAPIAPCVYVARHSSTYPFSPARYREMGIRCFGLSFSLRIVPWQMPPRLRHRPPRTTCTPMCLIGQLWQVRSEFCYDRLCAVPVVIFSRAQTSASSRDTPACRADPNTQQCCVSRVRHYQEIRQTQLLCSWGRLVQ